MISSISKCLRLLDPVFQALLVSLAVGECAANDAFADVHIHFNWDQKEVIDARSIVEKLRAADVSFAVVSGTPSELALELGLESGGFILPLFSPYTHELGRQDWYLSEQPLHLPEQGLRGGGYRGIGEIHFMSGFRPRLDNPIFLRLLALAEEYRVPVLIHIDAADESPFVELCRARPDLRLLVAHAGGNLQARQVRRIVEKCDNAMIDLSARDPWRYGGLTGEDGRLLPAWRELVVDHPERFMVGTDPVWKVTRTQSWDQSDDGWDYFERLMAYHRRWIDELPGPVGQRVRLDNALRFFEIDTRSLGD